MEPKQIDEFTLTEKLINTAQNINEIRDVIRQITKKITGPELSKTACTSEPWPPELSLHEWAGDNLNQTSFILSDLRELSQSI